MGALVFAQEMTGDVATNSDDHTAREESEGKIVWEQLQAKKLTCKDLSDDNFGTLGEYFMGQMMGDSHEAMNNMMIQMMGEKSEEQMHIVMGKRLERLRCFRRVSIASRRLYADDEYDVGSPLAGRTGVVVSRRT